jgi:hypothetical protein
MHICLLRIRMKYGGRACSDLPEEVRNYVDVSAGKFTRGWFVERDNNKRGSSAVLGLLRRFLDAGLTLPAPEFLGTDDERGRQQQLVLWSELFGQAETGNETHHSAQNR